MRKSRGKVNWRIIVFFLVFTSLIWLVLQLSKIYSHQFLVEIQLQDLPAAVEVDNVELKVDVEMSGFQLLKYVTRDLYFTYKVDDSKNIKDNHIILDDDVLLAELEKLFSTTSSVVAGFSPSKIPVETQKSKILPLVFNDHINFKNGFNSLDGIRYNKKEVEVSAPNFILDTLQKIHVSRLQFDDLSVDEEGEVKLKNPAPDFVKLSDDILTYQIKVEEMTEKEISVPVQISNLPNQFKIKTMPDQIKIVFHVPKDLYEEINAGDFDVEIDYNQRIEELGVLLPKLLKSHDRVMNPKILPQKIEYLLVD